jgi:hypothetical protein
MADIFENSLDLNLKQSKLTRLNFKQALLTSMPTLLKIDAYFA